MTAEQRRRAVTWSRSSRQISERRARRIVGLSASSYRYVSRRAEHLAVPRRRGRRKHVSTPWVASPARRRPTERWSMDFVRDTFADGRAFRAVTLVDDLPVVLPHSGRAVRIPNCVRLRGAGTDEVAGVASDLISPVAPVAHDRAPRRPCRRSQLPSTRAQP